MANPQKLLSPTKHPKGIIAIFRNSLETTFGNSERRNLRTNPVRADPEIRKKQDYSEMRDNDKSKSEIWDRQGATGKPAISTRRNTKKEPEGSFFSGLDHIEVGTEGRMIGIILSSLWHLLYLLIIAVIVVATAIIITIVIAIIVTAIVISVIACIIITACRRAVFRLACLPGWILNDILAILRLCVCLA